MLRIYQLHTYPDISHAAGSWHDSSFNLTSHIRRLQ